MKIIQRGHVYELDQRLARNAGGSDTLKQMLIQFVNLEPGHEAHGTTTQEILRVLIDRTHYCHNCLPHRVNEGIIYHLRMALVLHEARALEQKAKKGEIKPERIMVDPDGHFALDTIIGNNPMEEKVLLPVPPYGHEQCNHRSGK